MFSLGLHWPLLQTVAWAGMIASYSRDASLQEAISKTFDGEHPCTLCETIEEGRQAEAEGSDQRHASKIKLDLGVISQPAGFYFAETRESYPAFARRPHPRGEEPPTPHPRRSSVGTLA